MKKKFLLVLVFFLIPIQVFAKCDPEQCQFTGSGDCNWETEYCLDFCCVAKPTGPALPTIPPSGGSYTYQRCAAGEYLSCGTVAEATIQNKID
jgi:hypothetical protein